MKREERGEEESDDFSQIKKHKYEQEKWTIPTQSNVQKPLALNPPGQQLFEYRERMNILNSCYNKVDPLNPAVKLNTSYPLVYLYDTMQNKWCFNLITLWNNVEGYLNYDLKSMFDNFGKDYVMTEIRTPTAIFRITIPIFYNIKKSFFKYAHQIDIP